MMGKVLFFFLLKDNKQLLQLQGGGWQPMDGHAELPSYNWPNEQIQWEASSTHSRRYSGERRSGHPGVIPQVESKRYL